MPPALFLQDVASFALFLTPNLPEILLSWRSQHAIPVYASIISAVWLLIYAITPKCAEWLGFTAKSDSMTRQHGNGHILAHGGRVIFAIEVLTLLGSLELLRVSLLRAQALGDWQNIELIFQSIPFDSDLPTTEQTASWLSFILFSFLDSFVWKASKTPRLSLSDLPPLSDLDRAKNLVGAASPYLDPLYDDGKRKTSERRAQPYHMFSNVAYVFRKDILTLTFLLLGNIVTGLTAPYGLKRLLEYMESNGKDATIKPWVWIASLFLAPFTGTLISQQYQRILTRGTVHLEAILTQLILKHALRTRVISESMAEPLAPTIPLDSENSADTTATTPVQSESKSIVANNPADAAKTLVGKMNNLISTDLQAITRGSEFLQVFLAGPLMILLSIGALVGFAVMASFMPIPVYITKLLQGASKEVSAKGDDRIETVTETINVIRMVKMFGWEKRMASEIDEKRDAELKWVWWNKMYSLVTLCFQFIIPAVTMCVTFSVYALVMKQPLNAATVFSSIALFDILRSRMYTFFTWLPLVIKASVSLQRISDFLYKADLIDEFSESSQETLSGPEHSEDIGFRAATFVWSKTESSSGKTSVLMALLGEMHFVPSGPEAWFNLPRSGGIAYAAQESWVLNATIRDNILFGAPFDEERYNKVIYQCSLTRDLELFGAGDLTEVGEKGLTLSGGQKARVTLARAIYSSAEILLLDDVLAALDVHTAKWIVHKCFDGDLLQGRTVILVTHNISLVAPISNFVVSLGNGRIQSQGSISDALSNSTAALSAQDTKDKEMDEEAERETGVRKKSNELKDAGKFVMEEESGKGHLSWDSLKMYLSALGGSHRATFWTIFTTAIILECLFDVLQPWLLGAWASEYSRYPAEEVNVSFYLMGYILLMSLMLILYFVAQGVFTFGALRGSAYLHRQLIETILGATLRWLDKTPASRIITRVTQDVAAGKSQFDTIIPELFVHMFELVVVITMRFLAILIYTPSVGMFAIAIVITGGLLGNVYTKSRLSVKREMSKSKAPVMAHFGASIEGIRSIRAFGVQSFVLLESLALIDDYSRASRVFNDLTRWISVRVDALGGLFAALLGVHYVYYNGTVSASNSAFTLSLAVGFGRMVLGFVQFLNMFESNGNSLERLQEYMVIEREAMPRINGVPSAHWPSSGELRVENLTASYSPDGPEVLHELTFDIKAGERIGVVGRTGSGKSTLALALLRCIFTQGNVFYDGIYDSVLNASLRDAGLYAIQEGGQEAHITLDSTIARAGNNFSVGQRQIIALARAMVRESKLLILDEATSAIDYKTDAIIQTTLRTQLGSDVTIITIAHRLQTIIDADRVMVLDAGKIVEFDAPQVLLQKDSGYLRALVDESGDAEGLYAEAARAYGT
ncbi:hypothetical protein H0H92_011134 [Tricholoma furcatifolium]|nr:hypothetical protein H0H92_011134 [Tricholoma furcatifolium]